MANALPGTPEPPRPHSPHEWHEYEDYQSIHVSRMAQLLTRRIVERDTLSFHEYREVTGDLVAVNVRGRVLCADEVTVSVDKWLEARPRPDGRFEVRGEFYTYHAWQRRGGIQELIRYDSSSAESLHLHRFDATGTEIEKQDILLDELPNLDQVVEFSHALAVSYDKP